jgi:thiosulfate/3-mercaptopyruvate sulfurtransferase
MRTTKRVLRTGVLIAEWLLVGACALHAAVHDAAWTTLITAQELHERIADPQVLVIDVRGVREYASGHIPGAINLPGREWRTPPAPRGQIGQKIFRRADGTIDAERYGKLLSAAGVQPESRVVIYGAQAGRTDGSVPASILLKLGHKDVAFLDGVGLNEWRTAGYPVSRKPRTLPASRYTVHANDERLWSYEKVIANLENPEVVIVDSRTPAEFVGRDLRGNKRGGHIPGAISLNVADFVNRATGRTIDRDSARERIESQVPKDKTVLIYCQSGTRSSHKDLILQDLGYENVVVYDVGWQEWGNRSDTPVEVGNR